MRRPIGQIIPWDSFSEEVVDTKTERTWTRRFGDVGVTIEQAFVFEKPDPYAGILVHGRHGVFLLAGWGFQVCFRSTKPRASFRGILKAAEKTVDADHDFHTVCIMH